MERLARKAPTFRRHIAQLLLIVSLPMAALAAAIGYFTLRDSLESIAISEQAQTVSFAIRSRIWFRGWMRVAMVAADSASTDPSDCQSVMDAVFAQNVAGRAAVLEFGGHRCAATRGGGAVEEFTAEAKRQSTLAPTRALVTSFPQPFRYDVGFLNGRVHGLVQVRGGQNYNAATIFFDLDELNQIYDLGLRVPNIVVGLVRASDGAVILSSGPDEKQPRWLPETMPGTLGERRWYGKAKDGGYFAYVSQPVLESNIHVLTRFPLKPEASAAAQFALAVLAPLLTLAILFLVSRRFIDTRLAAGVDLIEGVTASHARGDLAVRATVHADMPSELQRVVQAINTVAAASTEREQALRTVAADNLYLMRELHHRVKNSLQVIQSDLSLTRRRTSGRDALRLTEAESKVQVLSIGYRHALTAHGLVPVPIMPFVNELLTTAEQTRRSFGQHIDATIDTDDVLQIDRVIPLGLVIVEILFACLGDTLDGHASLTLKTIDNGDILLTITTPQRPAIDIDIRKVNGLRMQLGALDLSANHPAAAIAWQFTPEKRDETILTPQ